jgi:hypothetical protein
VPKYKALKEFKGKSRAEKNRNVLLTLFELMGGAVRGFSFFNLSFNTYTFGQGYRAEVFHFIMDFRSRWQSYDS